MAAARLVLLLCAAVAVLASQSSASKPNFVVLFVDDLGMNQVAVPTAKYGYTGDGGLIQTPNVARLAEAGMTFQNWYSSFHVCSPSRASMMTGRYSVRSGIGISPEQYSPGCPGPKTDNLVLTACAVGYLPDNETTTAEALKGAGYSTMMLGKWHLGQRMGHLPNDRGFDEYYGIPFSQDMGLSFWLGDEFKPNIPFQPTPLPLLNNSEIVEQPTALDTLAGRYAAAAVDFIQQQSAAQNPYYLYMSFNHVHAPNSCRAEQCGKSKRGPVGDAVEEMDWAVGQIYDAILSSGTANNTLIFFTSDNGAPLNNDEQGNLPLRDGKASTWEGGFREPGIAVFPGRIPAGSWSEALVSTMDIHPTLLAQAGLPPPSDRIIDGIDLTPLFHSGGSKDSGHSCIMFYSQAVASNASNELFAVRCGDYKAYTNIRSTHKQQWAGPQNPPLLFNVAQDVGESHPIQSGTAEYEQAMAIIDAARDNHLKTVTPVPDQNGRGSDPQYALCSDPHSRAKYPKHGNCTISPNNWKPAPICSSAACLKANPSFPKKCQGP